MESGVCKPGNPTGGYNRACTFAFFECLSLFSRVRSCLCVFWLVILQSHPGSEPRTFLGGHEQVELRHEGSSIRSVI